MQHYQWDRIEKEQLSETFSRQVIHGETMTVARVELKAGSTVPEHSHPNEQICMLEKGAIKFVIAGREQLLRPGDVLRVPPGVPHRVDAIVDSVAVDLFSPPREDWIRGDDAYLRK